MILKIIFHIQSYVQENFSKYRQTCTCKYGQFNSFKNAVSKGKFGYRMVQSLNKVIIEQALWFTKKLLGSVHGI